MATTSIDSAICARCGTCVIECPANAITLAGTTHDVTGSPPSIGGRCFGCGHCGAVCATGAVRHTEGDFPRWQDPRLEPAVAKAFLTGRRSVRRYRAELLDQQLLEDILDVARFAPTASHAQDVRATVVTGKRVFDLAIQVNGYYLWLEGLLSRPLLAPLLWFTAARSYLKNPEKIESVRRRARQFDREHDWLFFRAPAVVVLSAPRKNKMFGRTNCVIAAERMMQYAFAIGVGSCWIGYAEVAMQRRRAIADALQINRELCPYAVFTLGWPVPEFRRLPARRTIPTTWGTA